MLVIVVETSAVVQDAKRIRAEVPNHIAGSCASG
jgi:hypothetical protein